MAAHVYTEDDYKLQRRLSRGISSRYNMPYDLREDAIHFCVVKGLEWAKTHNDRISDFDGVLVHFTWSWTLLFYRSRIKGWRKNMNVGNIFYSNDPPAPMDQDNQLQRAANAERSKLVRLVTKSKWQVYLDYAERGLGLTEIACRTGVSKQAVDYAFRSIREMVIGIEELNRAS